MILTCRFMLLTHLAVFQVHHDAENSGAEKSMICFHRVVSYANAEFSVRARKIAGSCHWTAVAFFVFLFFSVLMSWWLNSCVCFFIMEQKPFPIFFLSVSFHFVCLLM